MKSKMNKWTAVAAVALATAFFSCSGNKAAKTATSADGTTINLPTDIHYYTSGERKAKKKITAEALSFKPDVQDVKEHEFENNKSIKELYILNRCVNIAPYGFAGCTNLERIVSTATIDVVNDNAFEGCTALQAVENDIRTIGLSSFAGCTSIERFISTDNIYWVRDSAFLGCTNLKSVILGITLTKFEDTAFEDCPNIEEISVPNDWRRHMFNVYKDMPNLKKVYLLSMEHYKFPDNSKDFNCEQVDLYVPDMFLDSFKNDESWSRFKSILPLSQTEYFTAEGYRKK